MREKGFTLIELLVALAVGAVILTGIVQTIATVMVTNVRGNGQVLALTDINRAALAIKNDLVMAQTTDLVNGVSQSSANLTWYDYTSSFGTTFGTDHSASYSLVGKELRRTYDNTVGIVGRYVTSLSFTQTDREVAVIISSSNATLGSGTETLNFRVHMRTEEFK